MAVFTTFSKAALQRYLVMFDIGELVHYAPITSGIEKRPELATYGEEPQALTSVCQLIKICHRCNMILLLFLDGSISFLFEY